MQVGSVTFEREGIANHAKDLVANIAGNLARSLEAVGVDILLGSGKFVDTHTIECVAPTVEFVSVCFLLFSRI